MDLEWMAWTPVTAGIFIGIALLLSAMAVWELVSPNIERKGFLPIVTSRGDRFFISLLGSAYIIMAWIGLLDLSLWFALLISLVYSLILMRWG